MKRRAALQALGSVVLSLGTAELAFGASLVAVRVWPADEYTRVTLESDTVLSVKHFMADNPRRSLLGLGLLASGFLAYALWRRVAPAGPPDGGAAADAARAAAR